MLSLKILGTLERERERESLTLVNEAKAYLAYKKFTLQEIYIKYLKIEML